MIKKLKVSKIFGDYDVIRISDRDKSKSKFPGSYGLVMPNVVGQLKVYLYYIFSSGEDVPFFVHDLSKLLYV